MNKQFDMFSFLYNEYKIKTPIRLIELFAGYGSQALGLKRLNANFEHWKICEWAINSIIAYADLHRNDLKDYGVDYSKDLTKEQVAYELFSYGVSANYNEPATLQQLNRMAEDKLRLCYNSIWWTNNLVDISKTKGSDLNIVDRDKYTYILTYSFPCQDLSLAGLGKGMKRNSGTRSGLLFEVERLLKECDTELPQILLMENVPQVIGANNKADFDEWCRFLESKGYKNYYELLNAKDYGIPQNRNRCFMVSILGDCYYEFPEKIPLKLKLKDMLEENVDEKYYLSEKMIKYIIADNEKWTGNNEKSLINKTIASALNTGEGSRRCDASNYISKDLPEEYNLKIKNATEKGYLPAYEGDGVDISSRMQSHRGTVQSGMAQTLKTQADVGVVVPLKRGYSCDVKPEADNTEDVDYIGNYSKSNFNQTSIVGKNGVSPTITENHGQVTAIVESKVIDGIGEKKSNNGTQWYQQDRVYDGDVSIAVTTDCNPYYLHNLRIRKLTPLECARLMGLTDEEYQLVSKHQTQSSQYHLFGDSIVIPVISYIFKKLL